MAINVSVEYNGGFLPDIILLTLCYCHRGTRSNAMIKRFCLCSLCSAAGNCLINIVENHDCHSRTLSENAAAESGVGPAASLYHMLHLCAEFRDSRPLLWPDINIIYQRTPSR